MKATGYLADTSAAVRLVRDLDLRGAWRDQIAAGLIAVCPIIQMEIFHSARSKSELEEIRTALDTVYTWVVTPDRVFDRALNVQESLIHKGTHRSAGPADLLVAATAEAHDLTLLHYDADFLHVAEVTGQPTCWVADRGTVT